MATRSAKRPIKHIPTSNANPNTKGFHSEPAIFIVVFAALGEQKPDEKNSGLPMETLVA